MIKPSIGDIWRIFYWKSATDHDAGIKSYTYLLIEQRDYFVDRGYVAIELETGIESWLLTDQFIAEQRNKDHLLDEYIVCMEKVA